MIAPGTTHRPLPATRYKLLPRDHDIDSSGVAPTPALSLADHAHHAQESRPDRRELLAGRSYGPISDRPAFVEVAEEATILSLDPPHV